MLVVVRSVRILYRVTQGHLSLTCGSSLYFTCCPILLLCSFVFVADLHLYTEHLFFLLLAVLLCSVLSLLNEWVVTIGRNVSTFHLYHDENEQVTCRWDNDDISYILGQQAWLDFNSDITLNQFSSTDRHVSTCDTLSRLLANKSLFFLLGTGCLAERRRSPFLQSLV